MCDCLVAVSGRTAEGVTLFAKNSDRPERECQPLIQLPRSSHPPGSRVRCTHIEIPQVSETYAVLGHSPWWVWGFEHGVNEHGVAIGNESVFSREPLEEEPGLIGMDLVRLGLERAASASEALEVIVSLLERYGQGGSAFAPGAPGYHNGFLLADPREAWTLQTSNRRWVAKRLDCDAISNHISIGSDWERASCDAESFARESGWWNGQGRLDFEAAYRNPHVPGRISEGRLRRSRELLARARGRLDRQTMIAILRDHLEGGGVRLPDARPDEERYFTLCMHSEPVGTTTASLVAPLPADTTRPWAVWVSFATPCTSIFLPVYLQGVIPEALARGGEQPSDESAWWVFRRLQQAAGSDFARHTPRLRRMWRELEEQVEDERPAVEAKAAAALAAGPSDEALRLLSQFMSRIWNEALRLARDAARRIEA